MTLMLLEASEVVRKATKMFSDFSVEVLSWKDSPLWLQILNRSPYQLHVYDGIVFILAIWTVAWFTDFWGYRTPKPDPRLFVPVKDRTAFESQPGQSRNVADALKVRQRSIWSDNGSDL
jgi:hypothetical protein